jgi:hypothetical protein
MTQPMPLFTIVTTILSVVVTAALIWLFWRLDKPRDGEE